VGGISGIVDQSIAFIHSCTSEVLVGGITSGVGYEAMFTVAVNVVNDEANKTIYRHVPEGRGGAPVKDG
jgi:hypothetical protein